ncbi:hypothetical protein ACFL59_09195 [Planctomycetota bacterium]
MPSEHTSLSPTIYVRPRIGKPSPGSTDNESASKPAVGRVNQVARIQVVAC